LDQADRETTGRRPTGHVTWMTRLKELAEVNNDVEQTKLPAKAATDRPAEKRIATPKMARIEQPMADRRPTVGTGYLWAYNGAPRAREWFLIVTDAYSENLIEIVEFLRVTAHWNTKSFKMGLFNRSYNVTLVLNSFLNQRISQGVICQISPAGVGSLPTC
jgi:hypothetical protein